MCTWGRAGLVDGMLLQIVAGSRAQISGCRSLQATTGAIKQAAEAMGGKDVAAAGWADA